jgi:hypothetical protein
VETLSRTGDAVTQRVTLSGEAGISETGTWSRARQLISELDFGSGPERVSCAWHPSVLQFTFPLEDSSTWRSSSDCNATFGGSAMHGHDDVDARVLRRDVVSIDGGEIAVCVVLRHDVLTLTSDQGSFTRDATQTDWYAPQVNQAPRIETSVRTTASYGGKTSTSESKTTTTMVSLKPE